MSCGVGVSCGVIYDATCFLFEMPCGVCFSCMACDIMCDILDVISCFMKCDMWCWDICQVMCSITCDMLYAGHVLCLDAKSYVTCDMLYYT